MEIIIILAIAAMIAPLFDLAMRYIAYRKSIFAIESTSTFLATDDDVTNIIKVVYVPGKNFSQREIVPAYETIETTLKQVGGAKRRLEYVVLPSWHSFSALSTIDYFSDLHIRRISSIYNENNREEIE